MFRAMMIAFSAGTILWTLGKGLGLDYVEQQRLGVATFAGVGMLMRWGDKT